MVARFQKTTEGYTISLTADMVDSLCLKEGSEVEVLPVSANRSGFEYATTAEVLETYERSKIKFGRTYEALAK